MKKFLQIFGKIIGWLFLLGVLEFIASFNNNDNACGYTLGVFIFILADYLQIKKDYSTWQELGKEDAFNKRFCEQWNPNTPFVWSVIILLFAVKILNGWGFFIFIAIYHFMNLWDRRFITSDIKQDLILEKLKNNL